MIESILTKLGDVSFRYEEIESLLSKPDITSNQEEFIKLSKEYADFLIWSLNSMACILNKSA